MKLVSCCVGLVLVVVAVGLRANEPLNEAQIRHDEMQIEIAWLADERTFACPLFAVFEGSGFRLYGHVPNAEVGALALKLATEQTSLPIGNALEVRPSLSTKVARETVARMQRDALKALQEAFPSQGRQLALKIETSGRITVSGSLPSLEDKRTAGRRLKQVHGCSAVVNQVQVPSVHRQGQPSAPVTADGRLVLAERPSKAPAREPEQPQTLQAFGPTGAKGIGQVEVQQANFSSSPTAPTGMVTSAAQPTRADKEFSALKLKRHLERVCGMAAREVHVMGSPSAGLQIRIKARSEEESKRLFDKLLQLPELQPYAVQLNIQAERR